MRILLEKLLEWQEQGVKTLGEAKRKVQTEEGPNFFPKKVKNKD